MAQGFLVSNLGAEDPRVARMAQQVKEVLPDVPLSVITRDLRKSSETFRAIPEKGISIK